MVSKKPFGRTKNGREVTAYTLTGAGGLVLEVLDWGGRVNRVLLPNGQDIVIGFNGPEGWENGDAYYGCLIGRYANRIKDGKFSLDGVDYTLKCNNFPAGIGCALHGSDGGCTKTDLSGLVVDTYAGDLETQAQQEGSVVNLVGHHTNLVLVVANGLGVTSDVEADAVVAEVAAVDEQLVAVHHGKGFLLQHLVGGLVASPEIVVVIQALQLARLKGASLCQLFDGYPVSVDEIGITHTILCDSSLCHCCEAAEPC